MTFPFPSSFSPYQEYDVKYRETLEDIGETGLQIHGFVIEYKETSYIS